MSKDPKDYEPAFPETRWDDSTRQEVQWTGMTLRDWFAGQALAGYRANSMLQEHETIATWAYADADALLKAREE